MAHQVPHTSGSESADRITRLEEAEAFAERSVEQLNGELVELNRRMTEVLTRLERVESRVERLMGNVTDLAAKGADSEAPLPPPPDDRHRSVGE